MPFDLTNFDSIFDPNDTRLKSESNELKENVATTTSNRVPNDSNGITNAESVDSVLSGSTSAELHGDVINETASNKTSSNANASRILNQFSPKLSPFTEAGSSSYDDYYVEATNFQVPIENTTNTTMKSNKRTFPQWTYDTDNLLLNLVFKFKDTIFTRGFANKTWLVILEEFNKQCNSNIIQTRTISNRFKFLIRHFRNRFPSLNPVDQTLMFNDNERLLNELNQIIIRKDHENVRKRNKQDVDYLVSDDQVNETITLPSQIDSRIPIQQPIQPVPIQQVPPVQPVQPIQQVQQVQPVQQIQPVQPVQPVQQPNTQELLKQLLLAQEQTNKQGEQLVNLRKEFELLKFELELKFNQILKLLKHSNPDSDQDSDISKINK